MGFSRQEYWSGLPFPAPGDLRDSLGKNTGVGCHFLLQGISLTQELNPCLLCLLVPITNGNLAFISWVFSPGSNGASCPLPSMMVIVVAVVQSLSPV